MRALACLLAAVALAGCLAQIEGDDAESGGGGGGGGGDPPFVGYAVFGGTVGGDGKLWVALDQWNTESPDHVEIARIDSAGRASTTTIDLATGDHPGGAQLATIDGRTLIAWTDTDSEYLHTALLDASGDAIVAGTALELGSGWPLVRRVGPRFLVLGRQQDDATYTAYWLRPDGSLDASFDLGRSPSDIVFAVGDDPDGSFGAVPIAIIHPTSTAYELRVGRLDASGETLPDVVVARSPDSFSALAVAALPGGAALVAYTDDAGSHLVGVPPAVVHHPLVALDAPQVLAMATTPAGIAAIASAGSADDTYTMPLAAYLFDRAGNTLAGPADAGVGEPNTVYVVATPDGFASVVEREDDILLASFGSNGAPLAAQSTLAKSGDAGCSAGGSPSALAAILLAAAAAVSATRRYRPRARGRGPTRSRAPL